MSLEAGTGGATHQLDGVALTAQNPINFQDSAEIDITNSAAGNLQFALKSSSISDVKLASNYSGIGVCTNQVVTALNDNAAPTCSNVAVAMFSSQAQNSVLAGPTLGAGVPNFRALTDDDVPDGITLANITQITTRPHSSLQSIGADDHHPQVHALVGTEHTASALTAGQVVRATGASTFAWQQLNFSDLQGTASDAQLASNYSGVGTCTNQFVRALNDNAAPTCATVALSTDTSGNYVANLTGGNGIAITGTPGEGWTPTVDVDLLAAEDSIGAISNNAGLELAGAASDKLALLQGCQDGEILKWEETGGLWQCATDATGGAGGGYDTLKGDTGTATRTGTEALKVAGTASEISTSAADGTDDTVTLSLDSTVAQTDVAKTFTALQTFRDTTIEFTDDVDASKKLSLQLSSIAAATTRTWTAPNASGEVSLLGQTIEDTELASNYSGVGACTNQVVTATNDNAAPTCANVSSAMISDGVVSSADLAAPNKTQQFCYTFFDTGTDLPATLDVPSVWMNRARALTLTEVRCEINAGSASINLQRDDGTLANVLSSDLACSTAGANGTLSTAEDNVAIGDNLDHVTVSVGASLRRLNVCVTYTVD